MVWIDGGMHFNLTDRYCEAMTYLIKPVTNNGVLWIALEKVFAFGTNLIIFVQRLVYLGLLFRLKVTSCVPVCCN